MRMNERVIVVSDSCFYGLYIFIGFDDNKCIFLSHQPFAIREVIKYVYRCYTFFIKMLHRHCFHSISCKLSYISFMLFISVF